MVMPQEETFVECASPVYGTPSSFRAEEHGALSVISHNTLQPDWGVIAQLTSDSKTWLQHIYLSRVKGHQGDHSNYQDLDCLDTLNIDADHLAGCYCRTNSIDTDK
eukprot:15344884-Ditylum_brightwellii.AAC.1